jgi:hypothetical protein
MRSLPLCLFLLAAPAAAPAQSAPIRLDPVTRIGCVDCDGPGEFRFPIHVGVGAWVVEVFDYGHGRFTRFDSAGTTLGSRLVNTAQFPILQRPSADGVRRQDIPELREVIEIAVAPFMHELNRMERQMDGIMQ